MLHVLGLGRHPVIRKKPHNVVRGALRIALTGSNEKQGNPKTETTAETDDLSSESGNRKPLRASTRSRNKNTVLQYTILNLNTYTGT